MGLAVTIDQERLAKVAKLYSGGHSPNDDGAMCAMEAVAYIAGESWSDHPKCACPVIAAFMRAWNDALPDDKRNALLLPIVPRLVGTKGSKALEARRATMAADWYVRVATPAWLRLAGLHDHADKLASFPEITSFAKTPSIRPALEAARKDADAAWSASEAAAWSAARAAALSEARAAAASAAASAAAWSAASAASAAAWSAASAASAAAWSAASAAARAAAWSAASAAARAAARAALAPTVEALQLSALDLLNRMIKARAEAEAA